MSSNGEKRKRTSVDILAKLKALDDMNNGISGQVIANNLGIGVSTVKAWRKNEQTLRQWQEEHGNDLPQNKKRLRKPENELVDTATWIWFQERLAVGCPPTGTLIQLQAKVFWQQLGGTETFEASQGWFEKWKVRHGIKSTITNSEKTLANQKATEEYKQKFHNIIKAEGLICDQVFNCEKTTLIFRQMPKRTLDEKNEKNSPGLKVQNERLTVITCSNVSGSIRLPLLVIGKYSKPRAIKNLAHLPVSYKSQKNAWISGFIFEEWFHQEFVPYVTAALHKRDLQPKAILFVDSAYGKKLSVENFQVLFFPASTTSIPQPIDQGFLQTLKSLYRHKLMDFVTDELEQGKGLVESLKNITLREVIFWVANAWNNVTNQMIMKSWKSLWPEIMQSTSSGQILTTTSTSVNNEQYPGNPDIIIVKSEEQILVNHFWRILENEAGSGTFNENDVRSWLQCECLLTDEECFTDAEIVELVKDQVDAEKNASENNVQQDPYEPKTKKNLPPEKILKNLAEVIHFCKTKSDFSKGQLLVLNDVREIVKSFLPQPSLNNPNEK